MATYTAVVSGDWNTGATWGGTVPTLANDDIIVINADVNVTLNSDISAAILGGMTINGSLELASDASAKIALSGNITGSGTLKSGTADTPLPITRKAQIIFSGSGCISSSSLDVQLYCYQPVNPIVYLENDWSGTPLSWILIDHSAGESLDGWGITGVDQIYINKATYDTNLATTTQLVGIIDVDYSAHMIRIGGGTYAARSAGDRVILVTRNIRIDGSTGSASNLITCKQTSVINAEIRPASDKNAITGSFTSMGGTISGCSSGLSSSSGQISGTITGCYNGLSSSSGQISGTISGCYNGLSSSPGQISGTISGCYNGLSYSSGQISGVITKCINGLYSSVGQISGTISGCYNGLYFSLGQLYGGVIHNTTNVSGKYAGANCIMAEDSLYGALVEDATHKYGFFGFVYNGDGQITTVTDVVPAGYTVSYKHTNITNATTPCFMQRQYILKPSEKIKINGFIKLGISTGHAIKPKLYITNLDNDSLSGGSDLATCEVANPINTNWQPVSVEYTNTKLVPDLIFIRTQHQKAGGVIYANYKVETSGGSNGWTSGGGKSSLFRPQRRF